MIHNFLISPFSTYVPSTARALIGVLGGMRDRDRPAFLAAEASRAVEAALNGRPWFQSVAIEGGVPEFWGIRRSLASWGFSSLRFAFVTTSRSKTR